MPVFVERQGIFAVPGWEMRRSRAAVQLSTLAFPSPAWTVQTHQLQYLGAAGFPESVRFRIVDTTD